MFCVFPSITEGSCPDCQDRSSNHGTTVWEFWTSVSWQRQNERDRRNTSSLQVCTCLQTSTCHSVPFTAAPLWPVHCGPGVSRCQHSSRLKHATSINTTSFFSVCWLFSTFVPVSSLQGYLLAATGAGCMESKLWMCNLSVGQWEKLSSLLYWLNSWRSKV